MTSPALHIPTWSPGHLSGKQKIPRNILRVHREQQELLDRQDAWNPDGFANVPAELLQQVKAQYIHSIAPLPSPRKNPSPARPSADSLREDEEQDEPSTPDPTATGSQEGTPIPWSPSPEHHLRPATPVSDGEAKDGTPGRLESSPENNSTPKQATIATPDLPSRALPAPFSSQKRPAEHGPSSPLVFKVKARVPFLPEFPPSSSVASEDGLEFQVPMAVTDVLPPVNKGALPVLPDDAELEQTPPSAQIIPASYLARTTPSRPPPEKRRRIMTKSATTIYSDYRSTATEPERASAVFPRAETEEPSMTRLSEHIADSQQAPEEQQSADTSSHSLKTREQPTQHLASSDEKIPPNGPPSQVPYTAYKVAYPDYKGSLGDFVRAVLCVHDLRKRSAIMEFLYDDFVRYYCDDYLQYIREAADGHGNVPVRVAIEFYNDQVSRPRYQKGVLTKENINDVLEKYPKMVRSISETLGFTTPVVLRENGDSSKPKMPIIPSPSTTNHLPKPRLAAKSITKALVGTLTAELASDPIHPPSSIPNKRIRPVIQTIDRSVPRRLSNRPLELEPPVEDEPIPGSDAAAPIEIGSASSSSSPSPSPPPPVLPQAPSRSQGMGPASSATKVTRPQNQTRVSPSPREASAAFKGPRLDTSPPPPPPSSANITTQRASISPPPPRRGSKVDVSSPALPASHQRTQQKNTRPSSQIVPGTPVPAPVAPPRPTTTTAPSPSRPLITQIPALTNFTNTNTNTNLPLLSQLSNAESIPDPSAPSALSSTARSKLISSTANAYNHTPPPPPPPHSRPSGPIAATATGTTTATHLNVLSTQISNPDSIPEPSLPPRLQRQQRTKSSSSWNPSSSPRLTSSNLSRLAHITSSSRKFLQRKPALGAGAGAGAGAGTPSSSASASGSGLGLGSGSGSVVTSSAATGVIGSGGIVKDKGKGKAKAKAKVKGKGKDTGTGTGGRDLRAEYFVNFVREKKMREIREATEKTEKAAAAAAAASPSHLAPESSNGQQAG
ncbi:hypothetical protein QBC32DRAFT_244340 [Pseudoneurospora amorphoporcata]|uniref:Uncharacterized protein n=1 Tax=Pseudoneurospora amorphoporcata TaxID=241081 RepID=A0AAN6NNX6_9PEZI|nr:hypothetical protein QBC32DRAFT_244340 [Pseudoneurospora amorphoporcata]